MPGICEKIASALQQGGNSSHRETRKDLKELQLFFFAVFVVLAVQCLHMIFSQLPVTDFPSPIFAIADQDQVLIHGTARQNQPVVRRPVKIPNVISRKVG